MRSRHRNKHHVGRLRIRAAALLRKSIPEWDVQPEDISPATGWYRTSFGADVYRWELFTRQFNSSVPIVCGCWLTLTQFCKEAAKYGCHVSDDEMWTGKDR